MVNILDYTVKQFEELAKKIIQDGSVVLHDQNLTREQHVEACARFGELEKQSYWMNPKDTPEISIVSGQVDKEGNAIGMFRDQELEWHVNAAGNFVFDRILCIIILIIQYLHIPLHNIMIHNILLTYVYLHH
jgi:hypothetical protein